MTVLKTKIHSVRLNKTDSSFFAFSFGFYILLNKTESFNSYVGSIIKVLAMSIGELDYTDNFDYHNVDKIGGRNISSQIMLVGFIIMMVLIMMNILLAVTVSKTEELEPKSKIMQAHSRIYDVVTATNTHGLKVYKDLWNKIKISLGIGKNVLSGDIYKVCFQNYFKYQECQEWLIYAKCLFIKSTMYSLQRCIQANEKTERWNLFDLMNMFRKFIKLDGFKKIYDYEYGKELNDKNWLHSQWFIHPCTQFGER